jgi:hypothetical protein
MKAAGKVVPAFRLRPHPTALPTIKKLPPLDQFVQTNIHFRTNYSSFKTIISFYCSQENLHHIRSEISGSALQDQRSTLITNWQGRSAISHTHVAISMSCGTVLCKFKQIHERWSNNVHCWKKNLVRWFECKMEIDSKSPAYIYKLVNSSQLESFIPKSSKHMKSLCLREKPNKHHSLFYKLDPIQWHAFNIHYNGWAQSKIMIPNMEPPPTNAHIAKVTIGKPKKLELGPNCALMSKSKG